MYRKFFSGMNSDSQSKIFWRSLSPAILYLQRFVTMIFFSLEYCHEFFIFNHDQLMFIIFYSLSASLQMWSIFRSYEYGRSPSFSGQRRGSLHASAANGNFNSRRILAHTSVLSARGFTYAAYVYVAIQSIYAVLKDSI